MARRTARKSRKRRRRSRRTRRHRGGGPGVAANATEVNFDEKPVAEGAPDEEVPAEAQEGGSGKVGANCGDCGVEYGACCIGFEKEGDPCNCDIN